jgi:hypothetical protein
MNNTYLTVALIIIAAAIFYALDLDASTMPMIGLGLDQWLGKRTYVKNWNHMKPEEKHSVTITGPSADQINTAKISYIEEELMYWRKANQIHAYFIGDAEDNGQAVYVPTDSLIELHAICNRIINECPLEEGIINNGKSLVNGEWVHNTEPGKVMTNSKLAAELLPRSEGFFFGSQDYDEWYMEDIINTRNMLDELFKQPKWDHADYQYTASW